MIELDAVNMRSRVEVGFEELRLGDTVQHWCKRGVSAAKVVFLTFKESGKVESFQVEGDPSNYYKLAFLRAWTYVPCEASQTQLSPRLQPEHNYAVDATLFEGFNNVEMVEVKVDNVAFEKELKRKQLLAMIEACQSAGIELRSTGMNIYDVIYALYEAGFRK